MFLFNKSKTKAFFNELVDFHNHILPGIDDGSKSISQSIEMLNLYDELGIHQVLCSPHVYKDLYPNTPQSIGGAYKQLLKATENHAVELLGFTAEYMVDEFFLKEIKSDDKLLAFFNENVLIEIPFFAELNLLEESLFLLLNQSYQPILAHPERYVTIKTLDQVKTLKQKGAKMQLNALSLAGYYGKDVQQKALDWLEKDVFDFVCTDAHNPFQLKQLQKLQLSRKKLKAWDGLKEKHNSQLVR
ncbi:MAG: tyrosine-protein phosphatase [Flavobacteriaceae bacterium]